MQRPATSAIWAMRVVCAPTGIGTVVQKPRRDVGAGGQLLVSWQRVKAIGINELLQGAHDRILRNPTVHGVSGEACTGHGKEKPQR